MSLALPKPTRLAQMDRGLRVLEILIATACELTRVPPERLLSRERTRAVSDTRRLIWVIARKLTVLSSQDLADVFGRCCNDVNQGMANMRKLLLTEAFLRVQLSLIERLMLARVAASRQVKPKVISSKPDKP